jgi:uncharacterized protein YcfL
MKIHHAALVLGLGLPACRSGGAAQSSSAAPDPMVALSGDPAVEGDLETLDVRISGSGDGRVLDFGLRNKSSTKLSFAWTLEWYDPAGARIAGSARAWTSMTLDAGATRAIQVPVPTPNATSWRLRAVRPGSNTLNQGVSR